MIQMREVMTVGSLATMAAKAELPPKGAKYSGSSWALQDAEVGQADLRLLDKQILEVGAAGGAGRCGWV